MSQIVITGATSFIGNALVDQLSLEGNKVYAVIRPTSPKRDCFANNSMVKTILCHMGDTGALKEKIKTADYFLHLGWDGVGAEGRANAEIQESNIRNALSCLQLAADIGCKKFLFAGSQSEYGVKNEILYEDTLCAPVINYAKGKMEVCRRAHQLSLEIGIKYYHARIFSVYGIGDHPWALVPTCIRTLMANEKMALSSCRQYWNYIEVGETADVIIKLLKSDAAPGIYNIASPDTRLLKSYVEDIFRECGGKGSLEYGKYYSRERIANLRPDITKIQTAIGQWEHKDFRDHIARMVYYYKETGRL